MSIVQASLPGGLSIHPSRPTQTPLWEALLPRHLLKLRATSEGAPIQTPGPTPVLVIGSPLLLATCALRTGACCVHLMPLRCSSRSRTQQRFSAG